MYIMQLSVLSLLIIIHYFSTLYIYIYYIYINIIIKIIFKEYFSGFTLYTFLLLYIRLCVRFILCLK